MSGTAKPSMRGNPRQGLMTDTPNHTAAHWLQDRALRALFWGMLRLPYRWRVPLAGWVVSRLVAPLAGYSRRIRENLR